MSPREKAEPNIVTVLDPKKLEGKTVAVSNDKFSPESKDTEEALSGDLERVLSKREKLCYGVGHVYNDLCASMWFSYLLIFFEKVLLFDGTLAGVVLLVGQLADGFSTPLVGIMSDRENKIPICARYGRRKIWHLIGTICVTISFPFIWSPAYGLQDSSYTAQTIYYSAFVIVFQFGWASVQISHLALIPDLTASKSLRTELNSIRYAFTVLSNLSVFAIAYFILQAKKFDPVPTLPSNDTTTPAYMFTTPTTTTTAKPGEEVCMNTGTSLDPTDLEAFRIIAGICVGVGLFFAAVFHLGVREPAYQNPNRQGRQEAMMRKLDWFKQVPFYVVAVLYMSTRLYNNLYQVYIPLLVQDTLCLAKSAVATVPFTMYFAGFFFSLIMKPLNGYIGRKGTFASGCVLGLIGCTWTFTSGRMTNEAFTTWGIFVVAVFLGSGGSTLLITSLSITADLIGKNTEGGAFVYGLMSLVDKFSNGIAIMIVQNEDTGLSSYYRYVIFYACGGACVMGLVATLFMIPIKISARRGLKLTAEQQTEQLKRDEHRSSISKSSISAPIKQGVCNKQNPTADILASVSEKVAPGQGGSRHSVISLEKPKTKSQGVCTKQNPAADILDCVSAKANAKVDFPRNKSGSRGNINFAADLIEAADDKVVKDRNSNSIYTIDAEMPIADKNIERILEQEGVSPKGKRSSISSMKDLLKGKSIDNEDHEELQPHVRRRTSSVRSYEMVSPDHNPTADILDLMSQNVRSAAERRGSNISALE